METNKILNILIIAFIYLNALINMRIFLLGIPFLLMYGSYYVFKERVDSYKSFFIVFFALLAVESLLIIYAYFFSSIFIKNSADFFIFLICLVLLILLAFINTYYVFSGRYKEFPWVKKR